MKDWRSRQTPETYNLKLRLAELEAERDVLRRGARDARIAELEAERDKWRQVAGDLFLSSHADNVRLAELEAEVARLTEAELITDAVLAEREACAKMFEAMTWHRISPAEVAAAIRARPAP